MAQLVESFARRQAQGVAALRKAVAHSVLPTGHPVTGEYQPAGPGTEAGEMSGEHVEGRGS